MSKDAAQQRAETENGLICEADVAAKPDVTLPRFDTKEGFGKRNRTEVRERHNC